MHFSQTAEYALRAMAYLAAWGDGQALNAQVLSEGTGIPLAYLSKVLRRLVRAGLLESQRGHGGGFSLRRAPGQISLHDILQAVDALEPPNRCVFGEPACDEAQPCLLHPAWSRLKTLFQAWATETTLADLQSPS